ncbi:spore germination protein KC [Bacillus freudenreichii]|nr:spore germination protein KC [Bacillus freudenreichii]
MKHRLSICLLVFLPMFLLAGCWNKKELTDLAFVAALGIDKGEDGMLIGTFQIINPSNVAGGLQGGSQGEASTVTVFTSTGKNIVEANRRASSKVPRLLYYSHANLLVLGEKLVKEEGLNKVLDALDRDVEFRKTAKVVIAHDTTAEEILRISTPIDKVPANKVVKTLKYSERQWGGHFSVNLRDILENLTTTGKELVIPSFKINGDKEEGRSAENVKATTLKAELVADGLALFKGDKLIGWSNEKEARGIVWGLNKIKETNITIDWDEKKDAISYQVIKAKTKVKVDMMDGKPVISILVGTKGDIGETDAPINMKDQDVRDKIDKKVEKKIKRLVHQAVEEAQENGIDIFGFGEKVYRDHPKAWKNLKRNWNDKHFQELTVKVNVDATILRTGLRSNPYINQID